MTTGAHPSVDWQSWLRRWDAQQTGYLPDREGRFAAMFDVLDVLMPKGFVALDLACGPGSLSQRLLRRFPEARVSAIDFDPVLLRLGQETLGTMEGRLQWIEADLAGDGWTVPFADGSVDAALSTTALHWLSAESLARVYRHLGRLIRPGGVVLNGDNLAFPPHMGTFAHVAQSVRTRHRESAFSEQGGEDFQSWWSALAQEPSLLDLFAVRQSRLPPRNPERNVPIYDVHEAALRDAGFKEVGVIWQQMGNRVLLAVR